MARPPPLEKSIEKAVVKYAQERGCLVRKMNGQGARSWPDRMFITPTGRIFFIEFKRPGGKLTPGQEQMLAVLRGRSVLACWKNDVADAKAYVDAVVGMI